MPAAVVGVVDDDAGFDELEHAASNADMPPPASNIAPAPPIAPLRRNDRRSSDRLAEFELFGHSCLPCGPRVRDRGPASTAVGPNPRRSVVSVQRPHDERRVSMRDGPSAADAMISLMRDLRTLPKAHLHLHLEGAMRPRHVA